MGYSMHVPCRTKKDRDKMVRFLKKHGHPFSKVVAGAGCLDEYGDEESLNDLSWEHTDTVYGPASDLSYIPDSTKWCIGFDFGGSGGGEGSWMKDLLRWIATKVGKHHEFSSIEGAAPYIIYDLPEEGWETAEEDSFDYVWPVLERSEYSVTKNMRQFLTTNGFRGWTQQAKSMHAHSMKKADEEAEREGWSAQQLKTYKDERNQRTWDFFLKVAKRTDKYVKKELQRLDKLWEARY